MKSYNFAFVLCGTLLATVCALHAEDCAAPLVRISLTSTGDQGNHNSDTGYSSPFGQQVVFISVADNLLPIDDDNESHDVFLRDLDTGELVLISVALDGGVGDRRSLTSARLDHDGLLVFFSSQATNLVDNDTNGKTDAFVRDLKNEVTVRLSVSSKGEEGNGASGRARNSADGRYVAFASHATNLVPDDTNNQQDIFVHDLWTGETTRVSVSSDAQQGNGQSSRPTMSDDGRYVSFDSTSTNLVPDDTNGFIRDVFVHDRWTGQTYLVSVNADGELGNKQSERPSISGDGLFVAFESDATNLVPDDTNFAQDAFVVEWQADPPVIERVSVSSEGEEGNDESSWPRISGDGRFVVFRSFTTNLVPEGASGGGDIYVHDRLTHTTRLVSTTATGEWGNGWSITPTISADGGFVVFNSSATNMVPADTNGFDDVFLRAINVDPLIPGDGDCDGDIDFADFAVVQRCFTLHWYDPPVGPECYALDFNFDGDVDRRDFAEYLDVVSGPR